MDGIVSIHNTVARPKKTGAIISSKIGILLFTIGFISKRIKFLWKKTGDSIVKNLQITKNDFFFTFSLGTSAFEIWL